MAWDEAERILSEADLIHDGQAVDRALDDLASQITERLEHTRPLILGVMIGGMVPAGMLLPRLGFPLQLDYVHATRYRGGLSGQNDLQWRAEPGTPVRDRVVLVVDDILDEGHTLAGIVEALQAQGAAEVLTAVLVNKLHQRKHPGLRADFVGLEVPDRYVFGVGMDYKGLCRNAPGIFAVREPAPATGDRAEAKEPTQ
ncbi:hypoxanthine-guanine phosphoribosyltransferase [Alkalilimnicola ehrlichii MLHE-1]|uniref:Phosphoribosyltransferase n=1 Tax=Alkalilimnicola ehrlichii (strain ATCC BAA-1101 / DSM 17681 / MLHE-1) TaxID=187272 RepID=Q0A910_ALKEH|nr:hypoxanthine-guanine phosphoribosyltransferase [Alkalilimnicola ehrlichii]ABI56677.1 phosphoribosyltransferase [Alkalilimnicola ehrlichii MLHE-1]